MWRSEVGKLAYRVRVPRAPERAGMRHVFWVRHVLVAGKLAILGVPRLRELASSRWSGCLEEAGDLAMTCWQVASRGRGRNCGGRGAGMSS